MRKFKQKCNIHNIYVLSKRTPQKRVLMKKMNDEEKMFTVVPNNKLSNKLIQCELLFQLKLKDQQNNNKRKQKPYLTNKRNSINSENLKKRS